MPDLTYTIKGSGFEDQGAGFRDQGEWIKGSG